MPALSSLSPSTPTHFAAPRSGIHAALWIPTDERGELMTTALAKHLSWLKTKGIDGILALGSTGEFTRMDLTHREHVLAQVIELAAPLPVIANISSIRLDEVQSLGLAAQRLGAVGVALMPPSFFPLEQEDILEFFLRAAEAVPMPFYLYNYPEVLGNRIGLDIITRFSTKAPLIGIKQSGSELDYHKDLIRLGNEKNFSVFTAADPRLPEFLKMGAAGCIGGLANFVPEYMVQIYRALKKESGEDITSATQRILQVGETLRPLHLPLNVRSGLEARGFDPGAFKTAISASTRSQYQTVVDNFRHLFQSWQLPQA